jgi:hypothetical protein
MYVNAMSDETTESGRKPWLQLGICLALVVFATSKLFLAINKNQQRKQVLTAAAREVTWAKYPLTNWPQILLFQKAEFKSRTPLEGGVASLLELPSGEIIALTAAHLLGPADGVSPSFRGGLGTIRAKGLVELQSELVRWDLFQSDETEPCASVTGLYGEPSNYDPDCDQLLLQVRLANAGEQCCHCAPPALFRRYVRRAVASGPVRNDKR